MFYPKRVVDIPDGKPKWSGINGDSELLEPGEDEHRHKKRREMNAKEEREQNDDEAKRQANGHPKPHEGEA